MRSWSCQRMQSSIGQRLCGSIAHDGVAAGQHFGDGVLDDHDAADVPGRSGAGAAGLTDIAATCVLAVRVVMALRDDDGRPASSRIERRASLDLYVAGIVCRVAFDCDDGVIPRIARRVGNQCGQPCRMQHVGRVQPAHALRPVELDDAAGKCAGLVDAQHVHAVQRLDGVEPPDDGLAGGHRPRTPGQADGDDQWQHPCARACFRQ